MSVICTEESDIILMYSVRSEKYVNWAPLEFWAVFPHNEFAINLETVLISLYSFWIQPDTFSPKILITISFSFGFCPDILGIP